MFLLNPTNKNSDFSTENLWIVEVETQTTNSKTKQTYVYTIITYTTTFHIKNVPDPRLYNRSEHAFGRLKRVAWFLSVLFQLSVNERPSKWTGSENVNITCQSFIRYLVGCSILIRHGLNLCLSYITCLRGKYILTNSDRTS